MVTINDFEWFRNAISNPTGGGFKVVTQKWAKNILSPKALKFCQKLLDRKKENHAYRLVEVYICAKVKSTHNFAKFCVYKSFSHTYCYVFAKDLFYYVARMFLFFTNFAIWLAEMIWSESKQSDISHFDSSQGQSTYLQRCFSAISQFFETTQRKYANGK